MTKNILLYSSLTNFSCLTLLLNFYFFSCTLRPWVRRINGQGWFSGTKGPCAPMQRGHTSSWGSDPTSAPALVQCSRTGLWRCVGRCRNLHSSSTGSHCHHRDTLSVFPMGLESFPRCTAIEPPRALTIHVCLICLYDHENFWYPRPWLTHEHECIVMKRHC